MKILNTAFLLFIPAMVLAGVRGVVVDGATDSPLQGATAALKLGGQSTTTGASGAFDIDALTGLEVSGGSAEKLYRLQGDKLLFSVVEGQGVPVRISASTLSGKVTVLYQAVAPAGSHSVELSPRSMEPGIHVLSVSIGGVRTSQVLSISGGEVENPAIVAKAEKRSLRAVAASIVDTLVVSKVGYITSKLGIGSLIDSVGKVLLYPVSSPSATTLTWSMADYCAYDGVAETQNPGFQSAAPLNLNNAIGSAYSFAVNLSQQGQVKMLIAFANGGTASRPMDIQVDGVKVGAFQFGQTGGWGIWTSEAQTVTIAAGRHVVSLVATTSDGGPNVDWTGTNSASVSKGACAVSSSSTVVPSSSSIVVPSSSSSVIPSSSSQALSSASVNGANGFAMVAGTTTGGGNATPVTVTTLDQLKAAASSSEPKVIIVSGTINAVNAVMISSNKTIIGKDKNAKIYGGIEMKGVNNVIVRNLNIQGVWPNTGAGDAVAVKGGSHHIWLDHLAVWDGPDGQMDLTQASSYITVSWCKFWYTNASHAHRLNGLIGAGGGTEPADWGKNKVTYHHNWFAELVDQRMPRLMYGQAHIYNNYYSSAGNSYCIGVGSYGAALIENNYFKGVKNPHQFMYDLFMHITAKGNTYDNTTGLKDTGLGGTRKESGQDFDVVAFTTPPYPYTADNASSIPAMVMAGAGPQ